MTSLADAQTWATAGIILLKLGLGVLLAGAIGWERELHGRPAGVRTHMLVAIGTIVFCEVGQGFGGDTARVAAQVVTGIGFLGAGTIMRMGGEVRGLTTAASIWATAAVGMGVAAGGPYLIVAVGATILSLVTLALIDDLEERFIHRHRRRKIGVSLADRGGVHDVVSLLTKSEVGVTAIHTVGAEAPYELTLQVDRSDDEILARIAALPGIENAHWIV